MSNYPKEKDVLINSPSGVGSMDIQLQNAGKRFNRDWIFRNLSYTFIIGNSYAIIGANGSGKSTLLQVIASSTNVSEGTIEYNISHSPNQQPATTNEQRQTANDKRATSLGKRQTSNEPQQTKISSDNIYNHISIATPYLEIIEEMTATEFLQFHAAFKPLTISINEILNIIGLEKAANKQIRYYSSGMKQRVKLAQAIFTNAPILLLDEPCTNLDKSGYELYHQLIQNYCSNKLIMVSSNDENEINFCSERLNMIDYK